VSTSPDPLGQLDLPLLSGGDKTCLLSSRDGIRD
jgi:hypothetical protein